MVDVPIHFPPCSFPHHTHTSKDLHHPVVSPENMPATLMDLVMWRQNVNDCEEAKATYSLCVNRAGADSAHLSSVFSSISQQYHTEKMKPNRD